MKKNTITIDTSEINTIEKQIDNNEMICIGIHYGNYELYFIEKRNYENDLNETFENILKYRKKKLYKVIETDLTDDNPEITVLMEEGFYN